MKNIITNKKYILILLLVIFIVFFSSCISNASEKGFEVELIEESNGKYTVIFNFDKEIDVEKFKEDEWKAEDWIIVNSKQIKRAEPISNKGVSFTTGIEMADGSIIQIYYNSPDIQELIDKNAEEEKSKDKGKIEVNGDNINGEIEKIKWTFNKKTGALTISGRGVINDEIISDDTPTIIVNNNGTTEIEETKETGAFKYKDELKYLKVEKGITKIDWYAFDNCENLISVEIENGLKEIGWESFDCCTSLEKIVIPSSVKKIDSGAFDGCDELTIHCVKDSEAHEFAEENDIEFELIEEEIEEDIQQEESTSKKEEKKDINVFAIAMIVVVAMIIIVSLILIVKLFRKK